MLKLICCLFIVGSLFAEPIRINSIQDIANDLESADDKTLLVLDVDEVLITTEDHFMHPYSEESAFSIVAEKMMKLESLEEKKTFENILSLTLLQPKRILVETDSPIFIQSLQNRRIKVIALTSCPIGPLGIVPKIERWRIDHLKSLGFDFGAAFPDLERHFISIPNSKKATALYEEGILFAKGYKKGDVLKSFLTGCGFTPSKVIFLDDLLENIENVELTLKEMQIEAKVYQYTGASRFFRPSPNEVLLRKQLDHLLGTQTWASDAEIERSM